MAASSEVTILRELFIHLHATDRCNLCCTYCYRGKGELAEPRYDLLDLESYIAAFGRPELQIAFYGGEPTLNPAFLRRVIEMSLRLPLERRVFHLVTNGTLLERVPDDVASCLSSVWVSFDGTADTIRRVRGVGIHEVVLRQVDLFEQRYAGPIIARMTVGPHSDTVADIQHAARRFRYVYFQLDIDLT
jgi:MoaA/NifB/PqqE/SkfB family radical SAM enzyme